MDTTNGFSNPSFVLRFGLLGSLVGVACGSSPEGSLVGGIFWGWFGKQMVSNNGRGLAWDWEEALEGCLLKLTSPEGFFFFPQSFKI